MTTVREAVDETITALGSARRPADTALVVLARQYADAIDGRAATFGEDDDGLDPLARYGPKLTIVLERLHARAEPAASRGGAGRTVTRELDDGTEVVVATGDVTHDELAAMRERRAGGSA